MLSRETSVRALRGLFGKCPVADLNLLFETLDTRSRMSVFRRLREVGYLSSYSHSGRYYTLASVPAFDEHGLWRFQDVGFSRFGTLRSTIANRVEEIDAGCTHAELEALLRIPVYNTLLKLVRAGEVRREGLERAYLYVSDDPERGAQQLALRQRRVAQEDQVPPLPARETVLRVLVEALHASEGLAPASVVSKRLVACGEGVTAEQVARVYAHFGLEPGKKTAPPP